MSDTPRETRVLDAVVALADSLLDDFDVVELLTGLTERCAELLDVEAAGFLLADPLRQLRLLAATSEEAASWNCSSCRPTKVRAWTATPPANRFRSPTSNRQPDGGRGCAGRRRGRLRLGARGPDEGCRRRARSARLVRRPPRRTRRSRSWARP